jgi:hypothetical protein
MDNTYDNPWAKLYQKTNSITENLMGNVVLSCNLLRNLQITTSWGYNSSELNEHSAVPLISIMPVAGLSSKRREVVKGSNQLKTVIFEPQINYNIDKNGHSISALVGATFQKDTKSGSLLTASDFMSDAEMDNLAAATNTTESFTYNQYKYNAIFARVGYNYARKYIVNFTGRRDGSSRFGPGKQFGNFGAIGVAWIFTKEEAIHKRLSFLSFGKLRASAGKTGNDQLLDYQFLNIYSPSLGYFGENGVKPAQLINPSYSWETINKKDVALELGFWEDRLLVIINAYLNRTSNQLLGQSLSSVTGFNTVMANLPAIIQNSGIELDITLSKIVIHSFTLKSSLNFSRPRNKLVSFKDLAHTNYWNMLTVGQPVTNRMLYHNDGIDQEKGIYTFGNLNEEGMLNRVSVKVGQQYFGGFRNSVTYNKVFSLDVLFQFVKQSGFSFNGVTTPGRFLDPGSNQSREFLNSWQKPNDKAKYQKFSARQDADDSFTKFNQSDMGIVDASFIRLKNISLSWLLPEVNPKGWLKRYKYQSAKIYIEGQNLWTITSFKGMDPETQQVGLNKPPLPTLRFITVGLKASF